MGDILELIMVATIATSILTVVFGFSVRVFILPAVREMLSARQVGAPEQAALTARMSHVEDRLAGIEDSLDRIATASEFDRQLVSPPDERRG